MHLQFDWLRHYPLEIASLDEIPLLGLPDFPWQKLSEQLAQTFECTNFEIIPQEVVWRSKEDLTTSFDEAWCLAFKIPTLEGAGYWLMTKEEVMQLECLLLTNDTNPLTIQDDDFKNSFYKFIVLETLYAIKRLIPAEALMPVLSTTTTLPLEDSLCLDVAIKINQRNLSGRIVISQLLRKSISNYSQKNFTRFSEKQAQNVFVPIQVEIGDTKLMLEEWKRVSLGDFITLDHCSIDPDKRVGHVTLSAFGQPAFKGELQNQTIKIIEFPLYQEEDTYMAKDHKEDEDEDDLSDFSFDDDDFDELDEDLFKDFEMDDEEPTDEDTQAQNKVDQESKNTPSNHVTKESEDDLTREEGEQFEQPSQGLLKTEQIPVLLTVELGKIQMSMDKLLQIEPGNLLEISLQPENGVNLTMNGKKIARAELIRIGENLGVRILELG